MKNLQTFEDFLNEHCCPSELQTNNSPEGFERWLEEKDVADIIEYAEMYGNKMYRAGGNEAFDRIEKLLANR